MIQLATTESMNNYPRHVGDFIRDTVGLSMVEEGAYNRLLDQYYSREQPLPLDKAQCYRLARAMTPPERKAVDFVLGAYFVQKDDGWHQSRADRELVKLYERSASASESAKRRWSERNANAHANAVRTHMPTQSVGNATQKPVTNTQETPRAKTTRAAAPLPDWLPPESWAKWRRHRGKAVSDEAAKLQIGKLEALRTQGHEPAAMIDLAIECNWATFWPPKGWRANGSASALTPAGRQTAENLQRWIDNEEAKDAARGA